MGGALDQFVIDNPNLLETPESGLCNILIAADKTIWGRFPDGSLHQFGGGSVLNIVGSLDPTGNIDYPAADAGDVYIFSADGTIGAPPIAVEQGEMLICVTDSVGGAGAASDFTIYQINIQYATQAVAGIIRLVTQIQIEGGTDNEAAVTTDQLYYLLQVYGIEWILTDEVRGRDTSGSVPLAINTTQNTDVSGPQSPINITTPPSVDGVNLENSANTGTINIISGAPGTTEDGDGGISGPVLIRTGEGQISSGSGIAGNSGNVNIQTGNAGTAIGANGTGGEGGAIVIVAGWGGSSTIDGQGGKAGNIQLTSGLGGAGSLANAGGEGGNIIIRCLRGGNSIGVGGTGGLPGDVEITASNAGQGYINTQNGGSVTITSGSPGTVIAGVNGSQRNGGLIQLITGSGHISNTGFPGNGGVVLISTGPGRNQTVNGGVGSKGGFGGDVRVFAGAGGNGLNEAGKGGGIELVAGGAGSVSDAAAVGVVGSAILITAGAGGVSSGVGGIGGDGGQINITAGLGSPGPGGKGKDGTINLTGFVAYNKVQSTFAAGIGGGFANATLLNAMITRVISVAAPGDSIKLPATSNLIGEMFKVRNDGANSLNLFSNNGIHTINGALSVAILPGASITIHRLTATELYVFD